MGIDTHKGGGGQSRRGQGEKEREREVRGGMGRNEGGGGKERNEGVDQLSTAIQVVVFVVIEEDEIPMYIEFYNVVIMHGQTGFFSEWNRRWK